MLYYVIQKRDTTVDDVTLFISGIRKIKNALLEGEKFIDNMNLDEYYQYIKNKTGISIIKLKEIDYIMTKVGYAFTWLAKSNGAFNIDELPKEHLKDLASMISWEDVPSYNIPDFDNDTIEVIRAKMNTVKDRLQEVING